MIIPFMLNQTSTHEGQLISDIWQLDSFWLEHNHKYIQWLFPVDTGTKFNKHAPVLSKSDVAAFKNNHELKSIQQKSLDLMVTFFGIERHSMEFKAAPGLNIKEHIWLKFGGHNHLRITRIIRSLALCDQQELAKAFQQAMISISKQHGDNINSTTKQYWVDALSV